MPLYCWRAIFLRRVGQAGSNLALREEDLAHDQLDSTAWHTR